MSWLWFGVLDAPPSGVPAPLAQTEVVGADGQSLGTLAVWPGGQRPALRVVRIDAAGIDLSGTPGRGSLVLAPPRVRLPFDDLAVQEARRAVLAGPPRRLVSTLVRGDSLFAGALTVLPDDEPDGLVDDPFARIFPARRIRFGAGLLGAASAPPGPVIERYGGGAPWPGERFEPGPGPELVTDLR